MNALTKDRKKRGMGIIEYCRWLDISPNTYRDIDNGNIDNKLVSILLRINKLTNLDIYQLSPNSKLANIIKK